MSNQKEFLKKLKEAADTGNSDVAKEFIDKINDINQQASSVNINKTRQKQESYLENTNNVDSETDEFYEKYYRIKNLKEMKTLLNEDMEVTIKRIKDSYEKIFAMQDSEISELENNFIDKYGEEKYNDLFTS